MIEFRVDAILKKRGRTAYWLAKEAGISSVALWRLKTGRAGGIRFDTLDRICSALKCDPSDVLVIVDNAKQGGRKKSDKRNRIHAENSP
jgi:putative transcriptional regulator